MFGSSNMPNMIKTQQDIIPRYIAILDKIKKAGWEDQTARCEQEGWDMYASPSKSYKMGVNMRSYNDILDERGIKIMGTEAKNTFVHEMQHTLFEVAKPSMNPLANIKLAFPLAYDSYAPAATSTSKQLVQAQISQSSKNDLAANGIDYNKLQAYYNTDYWRKTYTCHETELTSRLAAYREYLTDRNVIQMGGTILLPTIISDIKK